MKNKINMLDMTKKYFIIPARKGSKGIKDKNIIDLGGIPLFIWSLIHAQYMHKSEDRILFSSDSDEYLEIASKYSPILIKRSESLSDDYSSTESVMSHALKNFEISKNDDIVLLQPTSPFRYKKTLDKFLDIINSGSESTVTVKATHPFVWKESKSGLYEKRFSERLPRQISTPTYIETGSMYQVKFNYFYENKLRNKDHSNILITQDIENIDIDSNIDLELSKIYIEDYKAQWDEFNI